MNSLITMNTHRKNHSESDKGRQEIHVDLQGKEGKKLTTFQLQKYNVSQKILKVLSDTQARAILFSTVKDGKTTIDLFDEHRIPLSSIYKKISNLEKVGLLKVENHIISENGKKFKVYRSKISGADITIRSLEPVITLSPN